MDENKIFCTNCGCPIEDQSTGVCPNCGTPILPPQDNNGNFDNTYNGYDNQNMYYDMPTNNPQPKKSNALAIIIAIVVILCGGCFGAMYTGVIDGAKFGIVNQQKALEKIDKYIKNSEYEKACNYALVVQRAKPKNRELLEKLVVTINPVNSFKAYKMVENYANKVGEKNLDDTVKKWIEIGKTPVEIPYIEPNGGTYVYPPNVQMEFDATILGRGIFYTTDGSEPTEESNLYYNGVKIENDCQLKYFVINGVGEKSEVKTIDYEIDGELQKKVEDTLSQAENTLKDAVVGNEVGQCLQVSKDTLEQKIEWAKEKKSKSCAVYDGNLICTELQGAIDGLNESKLSDADRTSLKSAVEKANTTYKSNSNNNDVYSELSTLKTVIDDASTLLDKRNATQDELNAKARAVGSAVDKFNSAVELIKLDAKYQKFVGSYIYSTGNGGTHEENKYIYLTIDKVYKGKIYGDFTFDRSTYTSGYYTDSYGSPVITDDATWEERWSNENYFRDVSINNGKFTFDISGTCSYSSGYQETYTSNVTVDLTGSNPTVTLSNIGNGESYSIQLDRDY